MQQAATHAEAEATAASRIGTDIVVTGNIDAQVDLHIEGRVRGDVRCLTLILGEASVVDGSIYAQRVRASGTVNGAIETRDLAVEATAHITGDVSYERLRVANGGVVEGTMKRKISAEPVVQQPKLKLAAAATAAAAKPKEIYIE